MAEQPRMDSPADDNQPESVGGFEMTVASAEQSTDGAHRWSRRGEWLARWLLNEWSRSQGKCESDGPSDFSGE